VEFEYKNHFATEEEYMALQEACVETEESKAIFRKFMNKYRDTKDRVKLLNYKKLKNEI
jgi:hemerythrin